MYSVQLYIYYCLIYNTWYADCYASQLNFVEAVHSYCKGHRRIFSDNYFKTMELAECQCSICSISGDFVEARQQLRAVAVNLNK